MNSSRYRNSTLLMLSMFSVWQMGPVYYSSQAMSISGSNPFFIGPASSTLILAAGFVITIVFNLLFPSRSVLMGRVAICIAFLANCLMSFMPESSAVSAVSYCASFFCCIFLIGCQYSVEISLMPNDVEKRLVVISTVVSCLLISLLRPDSVIIRVSFRGSSIASVVLLALYGWGFFRLPLANPVHFEKLGCSRKKDKMPHLFVAVMYLASFLGCMGVLFSGTFAEIHSQGVPFLYLSGALIGGLAGLLMRKRLMISALPVLFGVSMGGFILAVLSFDIGWHAYPAIVLLSVNYFLGMAAGFFLNSVFQDRPYAIISQSLMVITLALSLLQSTLVPLFGDDIQALFLLMSLIMMTCTLVFISAFPYILEYLGRAESRSRPGRSYLSPRESEIVDLIIEGYEVPEIAQKLFLSPNTVKSNKKEIYAKLDVHSKRELFLEVKKRDAQAPACR
ncbi:MAG: helix-turn-helix transcriptional regulator [Sphaerochaetaceae bacterium]|nr:helix-turn-helix transcriptional regulator [Sphaerochaetaceae bacterium]